MLFDKTTKKIIGICDWEKAQHGSRVYDLVYSFMFTCFHRAMLYEDSIIASRLFLKGYRSSYPVINQEIEEGFSAYLYFIVLNSELEHEYYGKKRVDSVSLLEYQRKVIDLCINKKILNDLIA